MSEPTQTLFGTLQQLSGARFSEIAASPRDPIDFDLLRLARERDVALPTAGETDRDKFHGGFVVESQSGTHENVVYQDVSSMYPNIMRMCNISYETIIGDAGDLFASEYDRDDCVWSYIDPRPVKRLDDDELYSEYTDGTYKMVYDPSQNQIKWKSDWDEIKDHLTECYFLDPTQHEEGLIATRADDYIRWNKQYSGVMYSATKAQRNCFTPDTEVVTPDGIQPITALDVGDTVYSLNPETHTVEEKPVTETHEYPDYNGELVTFEADHTDFAVTPNHRMYVTDSTRPENGFIEAENMNAHEYTLPHEWGECDGERIDTVALLDDVARAGGGVVAVHDVHGRTFTNNIDGECTLRKLFNETERGYEMSVETYRENRTYIDAHSSARYVKGGEGEAFIPLTYDGDDWLQLLAWVITEGSFHKNERREYDDAVRGECTRVKIAQEKSHHRDSIRSLLESLSLPYSDMDGAFSINVTLLAEALRRHVGGDSYDKRIPDYVFDASAEQKQLFFETLIDGDGDENARRYTTVSTQLRDDVIALATELGYHTQYTEDDGVWRIYYGQSKQTLRPTRHRDTTTATDGVYCVTVADNHTLLAGRNGKFQWTGQSLYGVNGDTGFRMFDWRCAESVTIAGRLILGFMMEFFLGDDSPLDGYIPIGDTDGIGLAITSEHDRESVMRAVEQREDAINDWGFDEFARETFGADTHYIATEAETYSPRLFVPDNGSGGVKKTYAKWVTWDEGEYIDEIDVTGFEAVRSDVADVTAPTQEYVLEQILRNNPSTAQANVYPYLRDLHEQFVNHEIDVTKIGKRKGLSKHPSEYGSESRRPQPVFRGAKYAECYIDDESFETGGKPFEFRVKDIGCDDHPECFTDRYHDGEPMFYAEDGDPVDVIAVEDPSNIPDCAEVAYVESPYSLDAHWNMTVVKPLDNILRGMGWSLDNALDHTMQADIDNWK